MNLARSLERRLERLIEGLASKLFPGAVSAPELAQRLLREADLSIVEGTAGPVVPNVYGVRMNPDDLGQESAPNELTSELAGLIDEHARQMGWRLEGAVYVEVVGDPSMPLGGMDIAANVVAGTLARWASLTERGSSIEHPVAPNRCLIGRDRGCDVRLTADEVSRRHALIWREGPDVWVADLRSSNGTAINGVAVREPSLVQTGDAVVFGSVECTFRID